MRRLLPGRKKKKPLSDSQPHPDTDAGPSETPPDASFPDGVKVWHDCPDATVDICFIHGLTGNRDSTWTADGQSTPWPQTLLPPKLNRARVLTYGYDAYILRWSVVGANRLLDHATNLLTNLETNRAAHNASFRPLIFVAHSLGGLVCKEAILLSRNNAEAHLRSIFDHTKGIVFMGTPHKGSWMAHWAKIPAKAIGLVKSTNKSLLQVLDTNDQYLESIQVRFMDMMRQQREGGRRLEVTCFWEELPMPVAGQVVPKESAILEGYPPIGVHANHRDMVRFLSAEMNGFQQVSGVLVRWESQIVGQHLPVTLSESSQRCLRSLAFPEMQVRFYGIDAAAAGTCEWLLRHETYTDWAAHDRGILWIKGKPGSGKSTLLKYILDHQGVGPEDLVLSFFCHGRGNELQKTPLGLFRSLLHQVLSQAPDEMQDLVGAFEKKCQEFGEPGERWKWHQDELLRFFKLSLPKMLETRSVWLFIDALDECGRENAVSLVRKFDSLLQALPLPSTGLRQFHICFACRPYPALVLNGQFEINPEFENLGDISTYVRRNLFSAEMITTSTISSMIISKASGIFLWACIVVDMANTLQLEGQGAVAIEEKIQDIPKELDTLYQELIYKMEDTTTSLKLIQWICFATLPLSLDELRWAMVMEAGFQHVSLREYQGNREYILDNASMKRRVSTLSCGLAEVTTSGGSQLVQFIHQSVKDFFVNKGLLLLEGSLASSDTMIGRAHYRLSRICIRYLAMEEIHCLTSQDHKISGGISGYPFLHYATTSWLAHLREANAKNISQDDLLEYFDWPSNARMEVWGHIYKILDGSYSQCPPTGTHLIHMVSNYQILGPLKAILGSEDQLRSQVNLKDGNGHTPLSLAAEKGNEAVVQLLLTKNADIEAKDNDGKTPLSLASSNGHKVVVELLLTKTANIEARDKVGMTPLSLASLNGHEVVVELLLTKTADVEAENNDGKTSLSLASSNGHETVVELLITKGADIETEDNTGWTPILVASFHGHETVVELLLTKGADIEAKGNNSWTPLLVASWNRQEAVVKLLLTKGADIEAKDSNGLTPLSIVSLKKYKPLYQLLPTQRAGIEAKDDYVWTPLSLANWDRPEAVIKLLLKKGADIEAKGNNGWTPLFFATWNGHQAAVELLLTKGADIDAKGYDGWTPLSLASWHGENAIGRLLLSKGARSGRQQDAGGHS